jgi:hypothetical protein
MTDKAIEVRATEVPGMQIEFQGPIGPDGLGVGFRIAVDATISLEDLNIQLDIVAKATRRQRAMEQLPLEKQRLSANLKLLKTAEQDRARHKAQMSGRVIQRRGGAVEMPQDVNALAQFDQRVMEINGQIEGARAAIPYLAAVIAGEEPPELYPEVSDDIADRLEAAE